MMPVVVVKHSPLLAYRAVAVEQVQQRNMMIALAISIAIHALIIGCYCLLPSPALDRSNVQRERKIIWSLPPNFSAPSYVPGGLIGTRKVSDVKAGKVVPIPDVEANPNQTLAMQEDLKKGIALGGVTGGNGNGNEDVDGKRIGEGTPVEIAEVEPDTFVPVEHQPVLVRRVAPKYPELMLKAEIEGKVTVSIWVDKEGKPRQVRILKSDNDSFNEAAIEAAKQFLFTPAYMNSGPVSVWVSVPFTFRLQ
jgi:TonB family protein